MIAEDRTLAGLDSGEEAETEMGMPAHAARATLAHGMPAHALGYECLHVLHLSAMSVHAAEPMRL